MAISPLRFSGMATGLDTDSIIKQLMGVERAPLDKLFQNKQLLQWKQTDYRDLNTKMLALRTETFTMKMSGTYKQYNASSSNENTVSASASSSASPTSYIFSEITAIAKSSNIATADGQSISRDTSVVTGGVIFTPIDSDLNNTFKISYDGGAFVDITLDAGKLYNGTTPGGLLTDLVSDIQAKIDVALGAGKVTAALTKDNYLQFTANEFPASTTPKSIVLQEGAANDLLNEKLSFSTDATTMQISSTVKKINMDESIYSNLIQHRFKNTEDFGWIVNGSNNQTLGVAADNVVSTVDYNGTNVSNYTVTAIENQAIILGADADNAVTTINYNSSNISNVSVYVNETQYTVVTGKLQADLESTEVLASDDGAGKLKLTFSSQLVVGTNIQVDSKTTYNIVTDKVQADLTVNETLLENDGLGKAKFTFKSQFAAGTKISVDRHDFEFETLIYNQDGTTSEKTFNVNAVTETMNGLITKIGADSTAGLTAFYDTGTDKMVFNTKKTGDNYSTGDDKDIVLTGNFLTTGLQMTKSTDGEDAAFTINGLATTRKDNIFTINGVTFTLKGTTTVANPVNISITQDVDKVYNSIKTFVDKYNETIAAVNNKYTEKKDRNYQPLTAEQKEAMGEKDIELWEEKAKSGLLNADSLLGTITTNMRTALYDRVEGLSDSNYDQLAEIGITTSTFYQDRGKLVIDEAKIREAISTNPDKVRELFTNVSSSTDTDQEYKENGLAVRLYDKITNGISSLTAKAGQDYSFSLFDTSTIGKEITRLDTSIYNLEERLIDKENNYYKRFAALETAISKMNSQSSWLSQQFGGGSS